MLKCIYIMTILFNIRNYSTCTLKMSKIVRCIYNSRSRKKLSWGFVFNIFAYTVFIKFTKVNLASATTFITGLQTNVWKSSSIQPMRCKNIFANILWSCKEWNRRGAWCTADTVLGCELANVLTCPWCSICMIETATRTLVYRSWERINFKIWHLNSPYKLYLI